MKRPASEALGGGSSSGTSNRNRSIDEQYDGSLSSSPYISDKAGQSESQPQQNEIDGDDKGNDDNDDDNISLSGKDTAVALLLACMSASSCNKKNKQRRLADGGGISGGGSHGNSILSVSYSGGSNNDDFCIRTFCPGGGSGGHQRGGGNNNAMVVGTAKVTARNTHQTTSTAKPTDRASPGATSNSSTAARAATATSEPQSMDVDKDSESLLQVPPSATETQTINAIEELLANDMKSLSINERNILEKDVHGSVNIGGKSIPEVDHPLPATTSESATAAVSSSDDDGQQIAEGDETEENPTLIKEKLRLMNIQLDWYVSNKNTNTTNYERAKFLSPKTVCNPNFLILFLRAVFYDPKKAALRYISYYDSKVELWGMSKLVENITYEDFIGGSTVAAAGSTEGTTAANHDNDCDDLRALHSGCYQLSPHRTDKYGRPIFLLSLKHIGTQSSETSFHQSWKSLVKVFWYLVMNAVVTTNPNTTLGDTISKHGLIHVVYALDITPQGRAFMMYSAQQAGHIFDSLPFRFASIHFVFNSPILKYPLAIMQNAVGKQNRLRFLCHYGTDIEVQYALQGYGITSSSSTGGGDDDDDGRGDSGSLPIDVNGNLETSYHNDYLKQLQRQEAETAGEQEQASLTSSSSPSGGKLVVTPTQYDILMGNGKFYAEHPGNVYLQQLCESSKYLDEYKKSDQHDNDFASKSLLNQMIVKHIKSRGGEIGGGGRFLKKQKKKKAAAKSKSNHEDNSSTTNDDDNDNDHYYNYWIEVPDSEAWAKLTRIFRKLVK